MKTFHVAMKFRTTLTPEEIVNLLMDGLFSEFEYTPIKDGQISVLNRKKYLYHGEFQSTREPGGLMGSEYGPVPGAAEALNAAQEEPKAPASKKASHGGA